MYGRKERLKKLGIDILLMMIGLVIVIIVAYFVQTSFSLERQRENSETKFEMASQRMTIHKAEADEYLERYNSFSQAKADTIAFFYAENPDQLSGISAMANQWGLKELYIIDANKNIITSNTSATPNFTDEEEFGPMFESGAVVTIVDVKYYISKISEDQILIAGRESKECMDYIDEITSYQYSLSTIKVGSTGHIEVINKENNEILYDPSSRFEGKTLKEAGFKDESFEDGFQGWIKRNGVSYYSECKSADDNTLYLSMVPRSEISKVDSKMVGLASSVFLIIILILIVYIHLIRIEESENHEDKEEVQYRQIHGDWYFNKTIAHKIRKIIIIGLVAVFGLAFYVQTLGALSSQSIRSDAKQADIESISKSNHEKVAELKEEYSTEYVGRANNIAYLLKLDPRLVNHDKLAALAEKAQVKMIYVFNENGTVDATNASFDRFTLSTVEGDQSYEFWDIIRGNAESIVQEASKDDSSGEYLQYVGVERMDAAGLVQLGINPQRLENRLQSVQPYAVLENIAVENEGYLIGIDLESQKVIFSENENQIGQKGTKTGLDKTAYVDGYSGYETVNNQQCFVTTNVVNETIVCMVVPITAIESGRLTMTIVVTLISLFVVLIICTLSLIENINRIKSALPEEGEMVENDNNTLIEIRTRPDGQKKRVQSAASRWGSKKNISWGECHAEERLMRILRWTADGLGILMAYYFYTQRDLYDKNSIMSYIIHQKWEKVPNIFSFTYIAIVMLEVIVVATIIRKIMMLIAKNLDARAETIGRLLDSFIKYLSVIGAVFYCLNFIGVDSSTLLASAGLLSLVVGLGAQSLISDILAGIFIVFEGEFRVGDIITIETWRGTVLEIGVRSTKVEDASGNIKILNNSKITGVVNMTKKYSFAFCDVGIEYDESIERVERVLHDELPHLKEKLPAIEHGPYYKGVLELADSAVVIRMIAQCQESDRVQLTRDLNREVKVLFDRYNIGIAYPQMVIHQPEAHAKATKKDIKSSEQFRKEQKEESGNIIMSDE